MLIGLAGLKQSGKSTVASYLAERYGFTIISFADGLRQVLHALDPHVLVPMPDVNGVPQPDVFKRYTRLVAKLGYEQAKQIPDVRRLLQRMGTEAGRGVHGDEVWVNVLGNKLQALALGHSSLVSELNVAIPDVRFPNEASFVEDFGGVNLRVERPDVVAGLDAHESERYANELDVTHVLRAGSVAELHALVDDLMVNYLQANNASAVVPTDGATQTVPDESLASPESAQFTEDHLNVVPE